MYSKDKQKVQWWEEDHGFFGSFYMEGDASVEGYLQDKKQTLLERTNTEVDGIINLLNLKKGDSILDAPCGYGRHSIELAKRGYNIVGCDINSIHLDQAIKNSKKENVDIDYRKMNMIDMVFENDFDSVINMFYSFGFFETDEDNEKVLLNFYKALKKGGRFLMHTDVNIPRILSGKYKKDETRSLDNGGKLQIIDEYNLNKKRVEGVWIITDLDGTKTKRDYSVRVYTKDEFVEMCLKVGFSNVEVYGDWDRSVYSEDSEDMMIVATK